MERTVHIYLLSTFFFLSDVLVLQDCCWYISSPTLPDQRSVLFLLKTAFVTGVECASYLVMGSRSGARSCRPKVSRTNFYLFPIPLSSFRHPVRSTRVQHYSEAKGLHGRQFQGGAVPPVLAGTNATRSHNRHAHVRWHVQVYRHGSYLMNFPDAIERLSFFLSGLFYLLLYTC